MWRGKKSMKDKRAQWQGWRNSHEWILYQIEIAVLFCIKMIDQQNENIEYVRYGNRTRVDDIQIKRISSEELYQCKTNTNANISEIKDILLDLIRQYIEDLNEGKDRTYWIITQSTITKLDDILKFIENEASDSNSDVTSEIKEYFPRETMKAVDKLKNIVEDAVERYNRDQEDPNTQTTISNDWASITDTSSVSIKNPVVEFNENFFRGFIRKLRYTIIWNDIKDRSIELLSSKNREINCVYWLEAYYIIFEYVSKNMNKKITEDWLIKHIGKTNKDSNFQGSIAKKEAWLWKQRRWNKLFNILK